MDQEQRPTTKLEWVSAYEVGQRKLVVDETHVKDTEAQWALKILGNVPLHATVPNGYDEAGRQKWRLLLPSEVAERACSIAKAMMDEFVQRGWMIPVPADPAGRGGKP